VDAPRLMSAETFSCVSRRIFPYASAVNFSGRADPLLNESLPRMIRTARAYGLEAHVTTDGTRLEEGKICEIIAAGTEFIFIRLAGATAHAHDEICGGGSFEKAVWNADVLRKVKKMLRRVKPALIIDVTLIPSAADEIPQLIDLAHAAGAMTLLLGGLRLRAGDGSAAEKDAVPDGERRSWEERARMLGMQLVLRDENSAAPCPEQLERCLAIGWDGKVYPCCPLLHPFRRRLYATEAAAMPPLLGDLTLQSFPKILGGAEYSRFRDRVARGGAGPGACGPCPLRPR